MADRIERDARVVVLAHDGEGLAADRLVAKCRPLGAAGHDADVLHSRIPVSVVGCRWSIGDV
jgi:hypothetical protein